MTEQRCPVIVTESGQCVLDEGHGLRAESRDCIPSWALQPSLALDVGRLAQALTHAASVVRSPARYPADFLQDAEIVAREYARLQGPTDD